MAYEINPNDERLVAVNKEEEQALNKSNTLYNSMIADSDQYYQAQINAAKEWETTQKANQQAQTDFAIEQIEQQKDQATKDYTKEQSGAYVDWQKESNRYGANAEEMAASGLINTGYGESSQVRMYNTYQNRVASARESYNQAILNYNNAIKDAQLQNNSILAEIAYNALQQQLELSLQGFQYKNQLLETQANKQLEIKNMYHSQYQDVLKQINTENALQEQVRQYNANYSLQQQQLKEEARQFNEQLARQKAKDAQDKALAQAQLAEEKRQFDATYAGKYLQNSAVTKYKNIADNAAKKASTTKKSTTNKGVKLETNITFKTYSDAASYMRKMGVASGDGGLMTEGEWKRRKYAGSKSAEMAYSTYEQYLTNFVQWRLQNPQK